MKLAPWYANDENLAATAWLFRHLEDYYLCYTDLKKSATMDSML